MRLTLVGRLKANQAEERDRPATDGQARIVSTAGDDVDTFEFKSVLPVNVANGNNTTEYNNPKPGAPWVVRLEPSRLTVWNPEIIGPYGGRKLKAGQAEGGHIRFETIADLGFGVSELGGHLVLIAHSSSVGRYDNFVFDGGPVETATTQLVVRLRDFWRQRGHELAVPESLVETGGEVSLRAQGIPVEYSAIEGAVR